MCKTFSALIKIQIVFVILLFPSLCFSVETIQGHYCYTYGDKESLKEAKELTRTLAIRNAIESYRVYIESTTTVRDFALTNDIIQVVSSGYLKNMKVVEHKEEGRTICDTIEFTVSPKEIEKAIKQTVKGRAQAIEEKGIDNNEYLKIVSVEESSQKDKSPDGNEYEYRNIHVLARILREVYAGDKHLILFVTRYDSEGKEKATSREKTYATRRTFGHENITIFYPGELISYNFKIFKGTISYKVWLYKEKQNEDTVLDVKPVRRPKKKN